MGGGSGGGGNGGRKGGDGGSPTSGDAGQPGEVVREANIAATREKIKSELSDLSKQKTAADIAYRTKEGSQQWDNTGQMQRALQPHQDKIDKIQGKIDAKNKEFDALRTIKKSSTPTYSTTTHEWIGPGKY